MSRIARRLDLIWVGNGEGIALGKGMDDEDDKLGLWNREEIFVVVADVQAHFLDLDMFRALRMNLDFYPVCPYVLVPGMNDLVSGMSGSSSCHFISSRFYLDPVRSGKAPKDSVTPDLSSA